MIAFVTAGEFLAPNALFGLPAPLSLSWFPMRVAVLERSNGDVVLVDAGLSAAELAAPRRELGASGLLFFVRGGERAAAAARLAALGIAPGRVKAIVATHLHLDHIGAFVDFPNAEVITTAAELAAARRYGTRQGYVHVDALVRSGRVRPVLLEATPRHGFPGWLDLFGDGRVVLLDCRGHSAGHVAVLLTDPVAGRTALCAGDAAFAPHEYRALSLSPFARLNRFRESWLRESWGHLRAFESAHPETPVVLAHSKDPAGDWGRYASIGGHE